MPPRKDQPQYIPDAPQNCPDYADDRIDRGKEKSPDDTEKRSGALRPVIVDVVIKQRITGIRRVHVHIPGARCQFCRLHHRGLQ